MFFSFRFHVAVRSVLGGGGSPVRWRVVLAHTACKVERSHIYAYLGIACMLFFLVGEGLFIMSRQQRKKAVRDRTYLLSSLFICCGYPDAAEIN